MPIAKVINLTCGTHQDANVHIESIISFLDVRPADHSTDDLGQDRNTDSPSSISIFPLSALRSLSLCGTDKRVPFSLDLAYS